MDIMAFKRHWIKDRFERLEHMLQPKEGRYSHGDSITMADCVLIPQVRDFIASSVALASQP